MRIIICGAGQVGFNLARYLADQGNYVTVIDASTELIVRMNERLDVRAINGQASDPEVLAKAGMATADMVIAVTQSDEVNMITCEVAHALFQVQTKIARIRNQSYLDPKWRGLFMPGNINIDHIISPEVELARAISRSLHIIGAFSVIPLANDLMKIIGIRCTDKSPVVNTPISHINTLYPELDISIIGLVRNNVSYIPLPQDIFESGDDIYFVVNANKVSQAMQAFGYAQGTVRQLLILGGGNVGLPFGGKYSR